MDDDIDKKISRKYCKRFGIIAVKKGFITEDELKEAMMEQINDNIAGKVHRMLGEILFEKNIMTDDEINVVLNDLFT